MPPLINIESTIRSTQMQDLKYPYLLAFGIIGSIAPLSL
jgi:hypothetical protein